MLAGMWVEEHQIYVEMMSATEMDLCAFTQGNLLIGSTALHSDADAEWSYPTSTTCEV